MRRYRPFLLTIAVIILDQVSKALVVRFIPEGTVAASLFSDFLWICHVRNDAVAFSFGASLPIAMKYAAFVILPLIVLALIAYAIVGRRAEKETTVFQKWCLAGILGGGIGNLIDRLFRSLRVVDWISTDNYGWFGMDRFPTYNIADAAIVLSVIALMISLFAEGRRKDVKED